jgi:hypothetical protein
VGGIEVMLKLSALEVKESGDGSTTVIEAVPVATRFAAGTVATSCVDELTTVVSVTPLNCITDVGRKF